MLANEIRQHGRWAVLSPDYRIIDCGAESPPLLKQGIGQILWELFPGSEPLFKPHYDRAFRDGAASAVVRYAGNIANVHAIRQENGTLLVAPEAITVEGLAEVLRGLGQTALLMFECVSCGQGGCETPSDDWPACDCCGTPLDLLGPVEPDSEVLAAEVDRVQEAYGDPGLLELVWVALSRLSVDVTGQVKLTEGAGSWPDGRV